ncbi:hypothetical protein U6B65_04120 [Oscillospiraceae bacterium MB08-C2-2]|nr:hypothetical protein U6B65_04120 [Oscillospiraceae bacterium MB08-C2-2]
MMKKILTFFLCAVLLTSCSIGNGSSSSGAIQSEPSESSIGTNSTSISEENVYELFSALDKKALPVMRWYFEEAWESLDIAEESVYAPYYKVNDFATIAEMKAATAEVFTANFANIFFYDHAFIDPSGEDTPMYKEIDGQLYRNTDQGGLGWPYKLTDQWYIPYQDDQMIVMAVNTLLLGDETEWNNFLLRNEGGSWKLDSYFEFNPYMEYSNAVTKQKENEIDYAVSS